MPRVTSWLAVAFIALALVSSARAQVDIFLKFTPPSGSSTPAPSGDSTDTVYRGVDGWFAIKNFNIGSTNSSTIGSATGGAGSGKVGFLNVDFGKGVNSASPTLFRALSSGAHYDIAQIVVRKPGAAGGLAFVSYDFKLVFLTAQNWSGDGASEPYEYVQFAHGSFRITYRPQAADGTLGTPVVGQWNQVQNNATF